MTMLCSVAVIAFCVGLFIGDRIGWQRHRWLINRAINAGRLNLSVSRPHKRRNLRTIRKGAK